MRSTVAVVAYRVCKARLAPGDASSAARVGGRWNSPGRAVIYCGASQAGAMLEILAHANRIKLPGAHHVAKFLIPPELQVETVHSRDVPGWDRAGVDVSRAIGDAWLAVGATAVLFVPSAIARSYEQNIVLNPVHADFARLEMTAPRAIEWDARLFAP